ncbi:hypothetical protein [Bacillus sp. 1P02SD]|uniref:hypothetical protein n=1 Tax=Bacillus sp. 1P02SD TaxID=3132264 RepID=UPI0039A26D59
MNDHLIELLLKSVVATLPKEHRELYEYIVDLEDNLASKSKTSQEFMSLLVKHSPHKQAARHFNLGYGETIKLMREIEGEIDRGISIRLKNKKWIDFTDKVRQQEGKESADNTFYFLSIV